MPHEQANPPPLTTEQEAALRTLRAAFPGAIFMVGMQHAHGYQQVVRLLVEEPTDGEDDGPLVRLWAAMMEAMVNASRPVPGIRQTFGNGRMADLFASFKSDPLHEVQAALEAALKNPSKATADRLVNLMSRL